MNPVPNISKTDEVSHEEDHQKRFFCVSSCCGGEADIKVQEVHQEANQKTTKVAKDCCVIL